MTNSPMATDDDLDSRLAFREEIEQQMKERGVHPVTLVPLGEKAEEQLTHEERGV